MTEPDLDAIIATSRETGMQSHDIEGSQCRRAASFIKLSKKPENRLKHIALETYIKV